MSCPACKVNLPDLKRTRDAYRDRGLYVVAVHLPRMESDNDLAAIGRMVSELGITEPCAADTGSVFAERFETTGYWPYYYLFDSQRELRRRAAGGSGFSLVERGIERLLAAK